MHFVIFIEFLVWNTKKTILDSLLSVFPDDKLTLWEQDPLLGDYVGFFQFIIENLHLFEDQKSKKRDISFFFYSEAKAGFVYVLVSKLRKIKTSDLSFGTSILILCRKWWTHIESLVEFLLGNKK